MKKQNGETWCQNYLANQHVFETLEKVDADLAEAAHLEGCLFCGGKLHRGDYERKPRGGPSWTLRYSFCCSIKGCRRRRTPQSVRFMGRRVYAGLIVVLISAMVHALSAERVRCLREKLEIDRRTLERWRQWWRDHFVRSSFWKAARARFMPPLCQKTLPWSLGVRFELERSDRLLVLLQFLAPITTPAAWKELVM